MGRKASWPPKVYSRRGKDIIRVKTLGGWRDITLGPTGSEQAAAEYARIVAEMAACGQRYSPPSNDLTVLELLNAYDEFAEGYHDKKQLYRIGYALKPAIRLYGHTRALDFGPLALKAVRAAYVQYGYCRRYANQLTDCLRNAFRWAAGEEMIPHTIAAALADVPGLRAGKTEAIDHPKIEPAALADVQATLPHLPAIPAAMVRLQLLTGMRPGEVCLLRPCDLDRAWLRVEDVSVWLYKLDEHKNDWRGLLRWIPLGPQAQAILAPLLERDPEAYCFCPRETARQWAKEHGRRVKLRRRRAPGLRYTTQTYDRCVSRACKRAGVDWAPNQLRHTVATDLETRFDRETARCVLGHSTPSTTAIYARSVEKAAAVLARVG